MNSKVQKNFFKMKIAELKEAYICNSDIYQVPLIETVPIYTPNSKV